MRLLPATKGYVYQQIDCEYLLVSSNAAASPARLAAATAAGPHEDHHSFAASVQVGPR
jgi:hypothetical protein